MKAKREKIGIGISVGLVLGSIAFAFMFSFFNGGKKEEVEWGEWVTTVSATCEEAGEEMRTSLSDPSVYETRAIPATGHEWGEWETVSEPTCTVAGYEKRVCVRDETHIDYQPIEATGHKWGEWETLVEPTCTVAGSQTRVCLHDASHTDYRVIEALGHDWTDYVVTTAPTCEEAGEETSYCRNCNEHTMTRTVSALGHDWSEWVITTAPTESEDGEETRFCRNDKSHFETRVVPAAGSLGLRYLLNSDSTGYGVCTDYIVKPKGTVYIPDTYNGLPVTEIRLNAFMDCKEIEHVVVLGDHLTTIYGNAFRGCENLQSIEFRGNGLRRVLAGVFHQCYNLESVEFPEGTEVIGMRVFGQCTSLKSVSFPASAVKIGDTVSGRYYSIFLDCPVLESITVAEDNPVYRAEGNCLIERETNALLTAGSYAEIPQTVTEIMGYAFLRSTIESISIPASVEKIGQSAFYGCTRLSNVTFGEGALTEIGRYAFDGCISLEKIELPSSVITISAYAFYGCTSLREVIFGSRLQTIELYAFAKCDSLEVCEIPASVTSISVSASSSAFVAALTIADGNSVYFKDGGCLIERETNTLIAAANDAVIPNDIAAIGDYAFYGREMEHIVIPASVTRIGTSAFSNCASLTSVTFEDGSKLESIGAYAFYQCASLSSFFFLSQGGDTGETQSLLKSIGNYAFCGTALGSFVIPASVTKIGSAAFRIESLTSLEVEEGNTAYRMVNGCLMETGTGTLLVVLGDASVPETAKRIDEYALSYCSRAVIEIPAGVEAVGSGAFYWLAEEQTIVIKGFASQEEADAAWGTGWRSRCNAMIVYEKD